MADDIHKFLDRFLAEEGLSRFDDLVRFVLHDEVNVGLFKNFENLFSGKKSAGFKILAWFEQQNIAPLAAGGILVFADAYGEAKFVARVTSFEIVPYKAITGKMTRAFGHGDGTIANWRELSRDHLINDCREQNIDLDEDTEIVITWFKKVYPS